MKKQNLEKEIERLAQKFRLRAKRGYTDDKRHDRVRKDEARAMLRAEEKFGLTTPKIAGVFDRDERTVARKLKEAKEEQQKEQEGSPGDIAKRARLQVEFDPRRLSELGPIRYSYLPLIRKLARVSVTNIGEATALGSWGVLTILAPEEVLHNYPRDLKLHWVDAPYGLETDSAQLVDIQAGVHRLLDVAFSQPRKGELAKSPELVFGKSLTSGQPYSVTIGKMESAEWEQSVPKEGCWIATDIALAKPSVTVPGYMPPGRYVVKVVVGCDNGQGDTKCFEIISPLNWQDLQMMSVGCSQTSSLQV
jgi:hypothetical protein